jgi:hypothetical protein
MLHKLIKSVLIILLTLLVSTPSSAQPMSNEALPSQSLITLQGQSPFYVQLGIFRSELNGHSHAALAESRVKSHPVKVVPASGKFQGNYLVIIDDCYTIAEAREALKNAGLEGIIKARS